MNPPPFPSNHTGGRPAGFNPSRFPPNPVPPLAVGSLVPSPKIQSHVLQLPRPNCLLSLASPGSPYPQSSIHPAPFGTRRWSRFLDRSSHMSISAQRETHPHPLNPSPGFPRRPSPCPRCRADQTRVARSRAPWHPRILLHSVPTALPNRHHPRSFIVYIPLDITLPSLSPSLDPRHGFVHHPDPSPIPPRTPTTMSTQPFVRQVQSAPRPPHPLAAANPASSAHAVAVDAAALGCPGRSCRPCGCEGTPLRGSEWTGGGSWDGMPPDSPEGVPFGGARLLVRSGDGKRRMTGTVWPREGPAAGIWSDRDHRAPRSWDGLQPQVSGGE